MSQVHGSQGLCPLAGCAGPLCAVHSAAWALSARLQQHVIGELQFTLALTTCEAASTVKLMYAASRCP